MEDHENHNDLAHLMQLNDQELDSERERVMRELEEMERQEREQKKQKQQQELQQLHLQQQNSTPTPPSTPAGAAGAGLSAAGVGLSSAGANSRKINSRMLTMMSPPPDGGIPQQIQVDGPGRKALTKLLQACEKEVRDTKGYIAELGPPIIIKRVLAGEKAPKTWKNLAIPKDTGVDFTVPITFPAYLKVIKRPICLDDIRNKCKDIYTSSAQFLADMKLLADNCKKFNDTPDVDWIAQHAHLLYEAAKDAVEKRARDIKDAELDLVQEIKEAQEHAEAEAEAASQVQKSASKRKRDSAPYTAANGRPTTPATKSSLLTPSHAAPQQRQKFAPPPTPVTPPAVKKPRSAVFPPSNIPPSVSPNVVVDFSSIQSHLDITIQNLRSSMISHLDRIKMDIMKEIHYCNSRLDTISNYCKSIEKQARTLNEANLTSNKSTAELKLSLENVSDIQTRSFKKILEILIQERQRRENEAAEFSAAVAAQVQVQAQTQVEAEEHAQVQAQAQVDQDSDTEMDHEQDHDHNDMEQDHDHNDMEQDHDQDRDQNHVKNQDHDQDQDREHELSQDHDLMLDGEQQQQNTLDDDDIDPTDPTGLDLDLDQNTDVTPNQLRMEQNESPVDEALAPSESAPDDATELTKKDATNNASNDITKEDTQDERKDDMKIDLVPEQLPSDNGTSATTNAPDTAIADPGQNEKQQQNPVVIGTEQANKSCSKHLANADSKLAEMEEEQEREQDVSNAEDPLKGIEGGDDDNFMLNEEMSALVGESGEE